MQYTSLVNDSLKSKPYLSLNHHLSLEINRWRDLMHQIPMLGIETLRLISHHCTHIINDLSLLSIPESISTFFDVELFQLHTHKFRLILMLTSVQDAVLTQIDHTAIPDTGIYEFPFGVINS